MTLVARLRDALDHGSRRSPELLTGDLGALELDDPDALYAPLSKLNEARRGALAALTAEQARLRARRRDAVADAWQFALPANQAPGEVGPGGDQR